MHARSPSRTAFEATLQGVAGHLVERVTAQSGTAGRPQLLRWLLAIAAIFVAWRMWRGLKKLAWVAFGLGMALYWTGAWHAIF